MIQCAQNAMNLPEAIKTMNATQQPSKRRRLSLKKRIAFLAAVFGLLFVACELISCGTLHIADAQFSTSEFRVRQSDLARGATVSDAASETVHPYLGWVHNPQLSSPAAFAGRMIPVNSLGFKDDSQSIYKRSDDTLIVGIAGGSVAWRFSWEAADLLTEKLSNHPTFKGRRIQFVRMALPGYKQPQQLMAYNFLLAQGAEFDVIVNIDGFNETVLAIKENAAQHTSIVYPRAWHARMVAVVDPGTSAESFRLLALRGHRAQIAKSILASSFRCSYTYNLIWFLRDQAAKSELLELGREVRDARLTSFVTHGPQNPWTGDELEREVAALWSRSSLQMHHLCKANDTLYLHVLQPNQYVPNSKPLGEAERKVCYSDSTGCIAVVQSMFPMLQEEGRLLAEAVVEFSDQTMVFANIEEPLYIDPWCHFNEKGNLLLGNAIADRLIQMFDKAAADRETR